MQRINSECMALERSIKAFEFNPKENVSQATFFNKTEAEVWTEFIKGSESALVFIYQTYANKLFNYGMQFVKDKDFILDIIQDLFYQLIKSRHKLGSTTSIKYYLYSSIRRMILRKLQKESKIPINSIDQEYLFNISIDEKTVIGNFDEAELNIVKHACNSLPDRQREAILLLFYEGLSYIEIAQIMQIRDIKYARTLVYRALDSLKQILEKHKSDLIILIFINSLLGYLINNFF